MGKSGRKSNKFDGLIPVTLTHHTPCGAGQFAVPSSAWENELVCQRCHKVVRDYKLVKSNMSPYDLAMMDAHACGIEFTGVVPMGYINMFVKWWKEYSESSGVFREGDVHNDGRWLTEEEK